MSAGRSRRDDLERCVRRDCPCRESACLRLSRVWTAFVRSDLGPEQRHLFLAYQDASDETSEDFRLHCLDYLIDQLAERIPSAAETTREQGRHLIKTDGMLTRDEVPTKNPPAA